MTSSLRRALTPVALAAAGVLTVAGLTACGPAASDSAKAGARTAPAKPAADVLYKKARASALAAKSVHFKGDMTTDGQHMVLDLAGTKSGDVNGSIGMASDGTFELRRVAGTTYLRSTQEYWKKNAGAEAARMIGTKYIKLPADSAKDMNDLSVTGLLKSMFEDESMPTFARLTTKVEAGTVNGQDAWVLSDRVGGEDASTSAPTAPTTCCGSRCPRARTRARWTSPSGTPSSPSPSPAPRRSPRSPGCESAAGSACAQSRDGRSWHQPSRRRGIR